MLKTILSPSRYPFAVAYVEGGIIKHTVSYASTLQAAWDEAKVWNRSRPYNNGKYFAAEMKEIGPKDPGKVNTYWVII